MLQILTFDSFPEKLKDLQAQIEVYKGNHLVNLSSTLEKNVTSDSNSKINVIFFSNKDICMISTMYILVDVYYYLFYYPF